MNEDELEVQVVDRRLQVNLDAQQGITTNQSNEFLDMPEQGFEVRRVDEQGQQEEQQQEPEYKLEKMIPKQNHKERLIQQNIKLKTQIYELAKTLDQILLRQKAKKKNYGIGIAASADQDEPIREKRLEIHKQQMQIEELKGKIFIGKRQLQTVYNNQNILAKENQIKALKAKLKVVQDQKQGHLIIQKVQNKALKISKNEAQYAQKLKAVMNESAHLRKDSKVLAESIKIAEKTLMKTHDSYVGKHQKIKQLQQKLTLNKEKAKSKKNNETLISEDMIQSLQAQIKTLQAERKQGQKKWQDLIRTVDTELIHRRSDEEKKLLILREKEKELTVSKLKIKELRKLAKQMEDGPAGSKKASQDMDMSQFRHKRNIRYMDK